MKTFAIVLWIIGLLVAVFSTLLIIEVKNNTHLRSDITDRKREIDEVERFKGDIERLKKEIIQQKIEGSLIEKRIPQNEGKPLSLIKKLTLSGSQSGIEKLEFSYEDVQENKQEQFSSQVGFKPQSSSNIKVLPIKMEFECEFKQLYSFLKNILQMERLVSVEGIEVRRSEDILPRQAVSIEVNAYTFVNQSQ